MMKLPFWIVVKRNKGKGERASLSPYEGGDVPGGVSLGVVVCSGKYWRTSYFSLLIVCFYEGMNHKKR